MGNKSSGEKGDDEKAKLVDTSAKKREFDPNFKGPIDKRSCTDVICCCIFAAYMLGMIVVAAIAISQGHPKRLLYPTDSNGKVCGVDILDKPHLYFFDLTKCITKGAKDPLQFVKNGFSCPTPQVCIKKCPHININGYEIPSQDMVCVEGTTVKANMSKYEKMKLIKDEKCAPYYLKTKSMLYRCLPDILAKAFDRAKIQDSDGKRVNGSDVNLGEKAIELLITFRNIAVKVGAELKLVWPWILVSFVISMLLSVVYIVLARWITFPLVIFSSLGVLGLLGYGCAYMFIKFKKINDAGTSKDIVWRLSMNASDFLDNKNFWLVVGILLVVLLVVLTLIFIFLFPRLRLACGLITEASRAVCEMLSTLFFPLLPWILQLVWVSYFIGIMLFLMSNGTKQYQVSRNDTRHNLTVGDACSPKNFEHFYHNTTAKCVFAKYKENTNLLKMIFFHLFGWLWGLNFIIAFSECSLAGAFASYYWAFKKPKDIPSFPVFKAMWRSLSYHTGSLALGAAIIAIVQLIRILLEFIHRKLKENTDNPVADFFMKCLKCCFWCLEKCLRFINKNAYIMIAIYGKNFCVSAKDAVFLMTRNIASTVTINSVTSFILLLGKLMVTGLIGVASFFLFDRYDAFLSAELSYSAVPIAINTLGAFIVAKLFFSVYDMGIDTLFLSYLEDVERNDGSPEKPYYMTSSLQSIMNKRNKKAPSAPESSELDKVEPNGTAHT